MSSRSGTRGTRALLGFGAVVAALAGHGREASAQEAVGAPVSVAEPAAAPPGTRAAVSHADVVGTVLAPDGSPIRGAGVTFVGNGIVRVVRADAAGRFSLPSLAAGTYEVSAAATGYSPLGARTVAVAPNERTTLALSLPLAQASSLTTIASVRSNGAQTLSNSPNPSLNISTQPYAAQGVTRVSDILENQLSTTVVPTLGGGYNAPAVVALRGPDPSETLVDIDGHQVNSGSTGDFDLSLLDPADLQSVQVVYGIGPSSLFGPNTLGGALNVRTLEPTTANHALERLTGGSYGQFGATLQATGTDERLGYAFSFHRVSSAGELHGAAFPSGDGTTLATLGNGLEASSTIAKLRYALGRGDGFVGVSLRDQAVYRDLSATLSGSQTEDDGAPAGGGTVFSNLSGSSELSHNVAYSLDAQLPLGRANADGIVPTTATFRHQTSLVSQTVNGPGQATSPYLYDDRDLIGDDTLEVDHKLPRGTVSLKYALTQESLATQFVDGVIESDSSAVLPQSGGRRPLALVPRAASLGEHALDDDDGGGNGSPTDIVLPTAQYLAQTQRSLGARYAVDPTTHLHYSFAAYFSDYSTFGRSTDPRFGFVWTPKADTAVRFNVGSTFESPQLPTYIVSPVLPEPVDGYVSIGNPNATAERATSYDVGYEHLFRIPSHALTASLDLYRTDLHNGFATYFSPTPCAAGVDYGNSPPCLSYPVNVAREVYQGAELRAELALAPRTDLRAGYDIDSVYTQSVPPTALLDIVPFEQALGVPLHKYTLDVDHQTNLGIAWNAGLLYEGSYNERNLAPYATVHAGATWRLRGFDLGVYGTNLTNVYDFKTTRIGGGVPYGGGAGTIATNALPLPGRTFTLILTHRS